MWDSAVVLLSCDFPPLFAASVVEGGGEEDDEEGGGGGGEDEDEREGGGEDGSSAEGLSFGVSGLLDPVSPRVVESVTGVLLPSGRSAERYVAMIPRMAAVKPRTVRVVAVSAPFASSIP